MEVDGCSVVLAIAETAGHLFNHLDPAVEPLGCGVRDSMFEVRHDVRQMVFEGLGSLHHRRQFRVSGQDSHQQQVRSQDRGSNHFVAENSVSVGSTFSA